MPNHVRNIIKFRNLKPDDVDFIVNTIATERIDVHTKEKYQIIDFNKIIPQPQDESECLDDYKVNKDSCCEILKDRPWFDWYRWNMKHWDTKWNAYDGYIIKGKSFVKFVFNTAWSPPIPVYDKLTILGYDFQVRYADENYGSNCGLINYTKDFGWETLLEEELTDATRFAKDLWNKY